MRTEVICPMCSYRFTGSERSLCASCPVNKGCDLLCCPECGHSTIDPSGSWAARGLMRLFRGRRWFGKPAVDEQTAREGSAAGRRERATRSLRDLPPGGRGRVCEFSGLATERCRQTLTAYGVCPGQWVCVRRTSPVTVVEVDQLELAMEGELAELIEVDQLECPLCQPE